MEIRTRRIYDDLAGEAGGGDTASGGFRVLVDRLWPRGVSKQRAALDLWVRDLAPSDELRRWYGHDAEKWDEFRRRYFAELDSNPDAVADLEAALASHPVVTLLYSSREERLNNAAALAEYLVARRD
jgi:uncharacterized protein YeaO (DUF488 family)